MDVGAGLEMAVCLFAYVITINYLKNMVKFTIKTR